MISFIWSPGNPLPAGTGGSENYTVGQVRELLRRGEPAQVVTVGLGTDDGRADFDDIPFLSLPTLACVTDLDDTVVFVNEPHPEKIGGFDEDTTRDFVGWYRAAWGAWCSMNFTSGTLRATWRWRCCGGSKRAAGPIYGWW